MPAKCRTRWSVHRIPGQQQSLPRQRHTKTAGCRYTAGVAWTAYRFARHWTNREHAALAQARPVLAQGTCVRACIHARAHREREREGKGCFTPSQPVQLYQRQRERGGGGGLFHAQSTSAVRERGGGLFHAQSTSAVREGGGGLFHAQSTSAVTERERGEGLFHAQSTSAVRERGGGVVSRPVNQCS